MQRHADPKQREQLMAIGPALPEGGLRLAWRIPLPLNPTSPLACRRFGRCRANGNRSAPAASPRKAWCGKLLFGILCLTTLSALPAASAALPPPEPQFVDTMGVGLAVSDATPPVLNLLAAAGFHWVRIRVPWSDVERQRGVYNVAPYTAAVGELNKVRLRTILVLGGTNPLYASGEVPASDQDRAAFAAYCGAVARAVGGKGRWWEIWDKPNIGAWAAGPATATYVALLRSAADAIRTVDKDAVISSGGTSGVDIDFLREACARGMADVVDAVAVEPARTGPPESVFDDLARANSLVKTFAGRKSVPVWVSEWGYSLAWSGVDEHKQAYYLARVFLGCFAAGVPVTVWPSFRDQEGADAKAEFGLVSGQALAPRQAYRTATALSRTLDGAKLFRRMEMPRGLYGLVLAKARARLMALWSGNGTATLRIAVGSRGVKAQDLLGEEKELASSPVAEMVVSESPQIIIGGVRLVDIEPNAGS